MSAAKKTAINIHGTPVAVFSDTAADFVSLTFLLSAKDGEFFISDWLHNRDTVEFLGIWEGVYNPAFNSGEFAIIRSQAGLNSCKLSVKEWVENTRTTGSSVTLLSNGKAKYFRPTACAQFSRGPSAGVDWPAQREARLFKNPLAQARSSKQVPSNTRAVPLVRKNDAHQGRVSFLPKFEATRMGAVA